MGCLRKAIPALSLALPLLLSFALAPAYAVEVPERNQTISVEYGSAELFGKGDWVRVKAGDSSFGVFYGTQAAAGPIRIFAEYARYLGVAEIYDTDGTLIAKRPVPVRTFFGQSLDRLVEFVDLDGDFTVDKGVIEHIGYLPDLPVKGISLEDKRHAYS